MKVLMLFIITGVILLLNPLISESFTAQKISVITTFNPDELSSTNNDGPPAIPNIIWGNVYINGIKITSENECTLILKICDETYADYKIGEEKKYGDLYRFVIPAYSQNIDIFVMYNEILTKAYSISNLKTAEIIRYDISIITNRKPESPGLLAQLTSENATISVGGTTYERTISFKGHISDPDNDRVKLQIELEKIRDFSVFNTETILYESQFYESGQFAFLSVDNLAFGSYKWRARTEDENGNYSDWVCFSDSDRSSADFIVEPCLKLSDTRHNFNDVEIGMSEDWEFSISNLSNKSVILNQICSNNSVFSVISPNFPYELPAHSNLNVRLRFAPVETKTYHGTITVITDEFHITNLTLEEIGLCITIWGKGKDGKPDLKPTCITFSTNPVVLEKTFIELTIKNDGNKISPPGPLKLKLFVFDENEKILHGNILNIGSIENIEPGESIDISFCYIFLSSELTCYFDIEILPGNSMDCDTTNNLIRIQNFKPQPNPLPFLNFVGDLLTIAFCCLVDGIGIDQLRQNIISYAYEQFLGNYEEFIGKTDIDEFMTIYYRNLINIYRKFLQPNDRQLMLKVLSYAKSMVNNISNHRYPLEYQIILKNLFESFWRVFMQKNDQWSAWNIFLFFLKIPNIKSQNYNILVENFPADLIVTNSKGKKTSVSHGKIIEDIEDSFGFYFGDQITIAIIGDDSYEVKIKGISDGECALSAFKPDIDGENLIAVKYENIPITQNGEAVLLLDKTSNDNSLIIDNNSDGIADGSFIPDSVENIVLEDIQLTIPLNTGWNLISIPIQLSDTDLNNVLQSIAGKYQSVWTYENRWKRHFANAAGNVNDLDRFSVGKGYWINAIEDCLLVIEGKQIVDNSLQLNAGWNLVGYTSLMPRTIESALSSISNHYASIWSYDGSWKRNIIGAPLHANTLHNMNPGMGYWINVTSPCQWNIRSRANQAPQRILYCQDIHIMNYHSNIPQIPCVISGRLFINSTPKVYKDSQISIVLAEDGKILSSYKLGSIEKNTQYYMLEFPPIADISANLELYVQNNDKLIKTTSIKPPKSGELMVVDLSIDIPSKMNALYQNFPNPFNPDTWIPYEIKSNSDVVIMIHNVSGQLIRTLNLGQKPCGSYISKENAAHWDGTNETGEKVANGIYFYTIKTNEYTSTRKMILLK